MKLSMLIVGVFVLLAGLHWIGQGSGYFAWPHNPAMDGHAEWLYFGIGVTVAGLIIVAYSWRRAR